MTFAHFVALERIHQYVPPKSKCLTLQSALHYHLWNIYFVDYLWQVCIPQLASPITWNPQSFLALLPLGLGLKHSISDDRSNISLGEK